MDNATQEEYKDGDERKEVAGYGSGGGDNFLEMVMTNDEGKHQY